MLLALDTAGPICAACIYDQADKRALAEQSLDIGKGHCEHLMDVIAEVMVAAEDSYKDLTRIVTTIGPGSFTGIRVSVAAARGFGLGLEIPVIGVSSLEAILESSMQQNKTEKPLGVIMSAGRGEAYCQFNMANEFALQDEPFLVNLEDLKNSKLLQEAKPALCGNGANEVASSFGSQIINALNAPPISVVARLGALKESTSSKPEPLYLRKPDAKPQAGFAVELV